MFRAIGHQLTRCTYNFEGIDTLRLTPLCITQVLSQGRYYWTIQALTDMWDWDVFKNDWSLRNEKCHICHVLFSSDRILLIKVQEFRSTSSSYHQTFQHSTCEIKSLKLVVVLQRDRWKSINTKMDLT